MACCCKADLLVLLSDIDGLYTANPHTHPDAALIPLVEEITPEVMALADGAGSALGTGGMATKLRLPHGDRQRRRYGHCQRRTPGTAV